MIRSQLEKIYYDKFLVEFVQKRNYYEIFDPVNCFLPELTRCQLGEFMTSPILLEEVMENLLTLVPRKLLL